MMSFRVDRAARVSALLVTASFLGTASSWAQEATETSANGGLAEIVVTATKREENLQVVAGSVTALSGEALVTQGASSFSDYMTLVPSLADFSGGAEGHGAVILRGLNTGYQQTSNTVGYYIDDIPFSATSALSLGALLTLDPDLTDIDHIEVLKGPQATLYGASTLGGLIKVVTNRPNLTTDGGELRVEGSTVDRGANGYGLVGVLNLSLIPGQLALRFSAFDRDTPGYMTNTTLDTTDRNVSRKEGGRIALRWVPTEGLDIQLSGFYQTLTVDGWNYEYVSQQTLAPLTGPYTYSLGIDPQFHTTYEIFNATINYDAGSLGTLTNSTSYANYRDKEQEDYTQYYGFINDYAPVPVPANAHTDLDFGPQLNKFSEELRFTSKRMGPFEWIGGLFYTLEQIKYPLEFYNVIPPSLEPIPGIDGLLEGVNTPATYKEEAIFADLQYYFIDTLDLTIGGRYSHNKQTTTSYDTGFAVVPSIIHNGTSDTDFTYLAALSWRPTPELNTYARIASSYRPGGPEWTPQPGFTSFKPDSIVNHEIGFKGDWLQNTLQTNIAIYYMDWKDVQLSFVDNTFNETSNGGKATSKGVEFESKYVPIDRLTIGLNSAYTEAKIESVSAGVSAATGAVAGNALPYTPKWAASATADYVFPLAADLSSTFGATFRYQGSKWSDYPNDPNNTGIIIPAYRTIDLRAGLHWDRYKAQFRVANLLNEQGFDTVVQQRLTPGNYPAWASIIPPRTFILSLDTKF